MPIEPDADPWQGWSRMRRALYVVLCVPVIALLWVAFMLLSSYGMGIAGASGSDSSMRVLDSGFGSTSTSDTNRVEGQRFQWTGSYSGTIYLKEVIISRRTCDALEYAVITDPGGVVLTSGTFPAVSGGACSSMHRHALTSDVVVAKDTTYQLVVRYDGRSFGYMAGCSTTSDNEGTDFRAIPVPNSGSNGCRAYGWRSSGQWPGLGGPTAGGGAYSTAGEMVADVLLSKTGTVSLSEFHFEEAERRVVDVVGKAGTQTTAESYLKVGGTNVQVDWRIRSYDSEQRIDNAKSRIVTTRNEVTYTDCVSATAYDVIPWESNDLPSGQWNVKFELLGTQWSGGCTGGTERGILQVPKVSGIVWHDPFTGTCYAHVAEDRIYFDETWSCTFVLVGGSLVTTPASTPTPFATPPPTPTAITPAPTATPAPTVTQNNLPDVTGAINRQTDTMGGWMNWLGGVLNNALGAVTGSIGSLAGQLGEVATSLVVGDLTRMQELGNDLDSAWQTEIGPMATAQADITSVGAGLSTPTAEDCEDWVGVSFTSDVFGGNTITVIPGSWGPLFCSWKPTLNLILKWGANVAALGLAVKAWSRLAN